MHNAIAYLRRSKKDVIYQLFQWDSASCKIENKNITL